MTNSTSELFTVAIVGAPNVGKSTLFNRLVRGRRAITYNRPGVTRDYKEEKADIMGSPCRVVDTGGWDENQSILAACVVEKVKEVFSISDLVLFVIDGKNGISSRELDMASWLKVHFRSEDVILVVNKSESKSLYQGELDYFHDTIYIAAEHNIGLAELSRQIAHFANQKNSSAQMIASDETAFRMAVLGQPNAGKSTLINRLLGYDRLITSEIPGTTRDTITVEFSFNGRQIKLVDTAGIRRKMKVHDDVEKLTVESACESIKHVDLVCLVVDATSGLERQDKVIVDTIYRSNKPIIIALNKWDLIKGPSRELIIEDLKFLLTKLAAGGVMVVPISAAYDKNFTPLLKKASKVVDDYRSVFKTSILNRWLQQALAKYAPPLSSTKRHVKLKYVKQTANAPITLNIATNLLEIPQNYQSYLANSFRNYFKLSVIPVVIKFEKGHNPYVS